MVAVDLLGGDGSHVLPLPVRKVSVDWCTVSNMQTDDQMSVLWAKSDACGAPHSLIGHLMDTAAVAELIADEFMAPLMRARLDQAAEGSGRELYVALCGLHDIGKATPAFQVMVESLAQPVRQAGLRIDRRNTEGRRHWHHTMAGAAILDALLGPSDEGYDVGGLAL